MLGENKDVFSKDTFGSDEEIGHSVVWLKKKQVKIQPIGDIHIGAKTSRYSELMKQLDQADDDTYFVLLGDVIDNAIADSVGDVYEATHNPHKSLEIFINLIDSIKDRILGVVSGNHEERTRRKVGIDLLEMVCRERNIPYHNAIMVIDVSVGDGTTGRGTKRRSNYVFVIGHGYTSARTTGGRINANERITNVISNADVYITGHTHQMSVVEKQRVEWDRYNKSIHTSKYYLITIPAWLGFENYALRKFHEPLPQGSLNILLDGTEKRIDILLG